MYFLRAVLFLFLFLFCIREDFTLDECKQKLGDYSDREVLILNDICFVKNYDIFIDVDSFMGAAIRVH
jgi:hypothetical protein